MSGLRKPDEGHRVLGQAKSPVIATSYEYWLRARDRSGRRLPGRQHLDPVEMKSFLPYVVLIDIVRDGTYCRFRNRLNGTHVVEVLGCDVTGLFIEHMGWTATFDELYQRFSTVADEKVLAYGVLPSPARNLYFVEYEHLTLPLAFDGQTVDMLFGVRCALPHSDAPINHEYVVAPLIDEFEAACSTRQTVM